MRPPLTRPPVPPEDVLILELAATRSRRAHRAGHVAALADAVDPDLLVARLDALRMTGVVGPRALEHVPGATLERGIEAWLRSHRPRAQVHLVALNSICRTLEGAGIPTLPVKGPALARRLYGDVGARPGTDLDVLVPADAIAPARELLEGLGYVPDPRQEVWWQRSLHHTLTHGGRPGLVVELHHRVEWYRGFPLAADVLGRTTRSGDELREARPADELALLLLVMARDGFNGLRMLADVAALWDLHAGGLPTGALADVADRHPVLARPLATAAVVADLLVGLPARQLLDVGPALGRRSRLAARLADPWLHGGFPERFLADALLCDRRALRGWSRRRVIPREQAAMTYAFADGSPVRASLAALAHPVYVGARMAGAGLRRRHGLDVARAALAGG